MDSPALAFNGANIASGYMRVYNNANQAPTGTGTKYPSFNTVDADTLGIWDAANTRAVIKSSGFYSLFWRCTPNNNSPAPTTPAIDINGIITWCEDGTTVSHISAGFVRYLTAGDVVKACYYKGTTGTWTTLSSGNDLCEFIICGPFASSSIGTNLDVSVFPSNPVHYQRVRYTGDANLGPTWAYWDANVGHWLSEEVFKYVADSNNVSASATSTSYETLDQSYNVYLTQWLISTFAITPSTSTQNWTVTLQTESTAGIDTTLDSFSTGSTPDSAGAWTVRKRNIFQVINTAGLALPAFVRLTKVSTAGNIYCKSTVRYRLVLG